MIINKEAAILIAQERAIERQEHLDIYCISGHTYDMYLILPVHQTPVNEHAQYVQRVLYNE